ncbi:AraC family transcriptional regulator [Paenibacillus sp. RC67]|uniref:helix-turn-helix transcriptional regulator n=1 Tax=Paenibacillus sp. RC67 TaxID=3039392 RepID=UPI0024AD661F|nr:AraC family transcriptional regulator [Paenibacillus sp. RC67]
MQEFAQEYADTMYFTPDEIDKSLGLWLVRSGRNKAKPNYNAGPRAIGHYSMHFVRSGTVRFQYEDTTVMLNKGDMFCLFPDLSYKYRPADLDVVLEMTWIGIHGAQAPTLLSLVGILPSKPYVRGVVSTEVELTLQHFWSVGTLHPGRTRLMFLSLLYQLFDLMQRQTDTTIEPQRDSQKEWIQKSLDYMNTHYCEPIDVHHIAEHVGIHRSYFSKVFTEHLGLTPIKYLIKLRMNKAMQLLKETSFTVAEIAFTLQYSDAASFSRSFSLYFGSPPSHFRIPVQNANR